MIETYNTWLQATCTLQNREDVDGGIKLLVDKDSK